MVEKSKLTIAAEIAAIVGASLCAVGVFIAWLAYKDAHNPKTAAASAVAVTIKMERLDANIRPGQIPLR